MKPREIQRIMAATEATGAAWQVLIALAVHARDETRQAFPSLPVLVEETHMHRKSVQRAIDRLLELGEIVILEQAHRGRATTYLVLTAANVVGLGERRLGGARTPQAGDTGTPATDGHRNGGDTATDRPAPATVGPDPASDGPDPASVAVETRRPEDAPTGREQPVERTGIQRPEEQRTRESSRCVKCGGRQDERARPICSAPAWHAAEPLEATG